MTNPDILQTILKDSSFDLSLFSVEEINALRQRIFIKAARGKDTAFVTCIVRGKDIQLKPEEIVRQLYAARLIGPCGYPKKRLAVEYQVTFGREKKSADIVVFDKDRPDAPYIVVELKKPKHKDGKEQLRSYCNATGAPMGVWTNGGQISHYHRKDPNYFEDITDIPGAGQTLQDILCERFTLRDLIIKDKIANERKSLKDIILDMEDEVLANAGVDVFEEVFKLIFTKLYDEYLSRKDKTKISFHLEQNLSDAERGDYEKLKHCLESLKDDKFRVMEFRNSGQTDTELKNKIQKLFDQAKGQWSGVFPEGSVFELSDSHLAVCVSSLQNVKLFNSNLLVVDEAFEYLVNKSSKGEKGQYFTPRHVIDMCVQMLNPQRGEHMIDTASGSCGFPVHTIFKLTGHLFTNEEIPEEDKEHVLKVFGIDFDEKTVRVARTLNLIAGDGETNVLHLNTLDYERWTDKTGDELKNVKADAKWLKTYGKGFERLEQQRAEKGENRRFSFDLLMANPPFAGDIKETRILHQYELGFKAGGKAQGKVGRDILFIERNLDFLKPGGRMAIVLPQGRFNNTSDRHIREFISKQARMLAVVGLHGNTFKPHTGTKTSVLFVQKWNDDPTAGPLCPKAEDYPIFFAVSEKGGKDNSGEYVYVRTSSGQHKLDKNGHLIVDHDLHNHGGELPDGIAEAFIEWAKKEKLSFFPDAPFDEKRLKGANLRFSIVTFSQIEKKVFRLEAEFHTSNVFTSNEYLLGEEIIDSYQYNSIYGLNDQSVGYPVLRMNEFNNIFTGNPTLHSDEFSEEDFSLYALKKGDVLICRTNGNPRLVGKSALAAKDYPHVYESHLFKIRPKSELISSETLIVYLNTTHGKKEIEKFSMQGNQANFSLAKFKEMRIPKFNKKLNAIITDIVSSSFLYLTDSEEKYTQSEKLLLSELGLTNWKPKHQLSFVRNFSEAEEAERLDAEYYQPKYDELIEIISSSSAYSKTIAEIQTYNARGLQPEYDENGKLDVIASRHILENGLDYDSFERTDSVNWNLQKKARVYKGDILTYTTGANIGRTAHYAIDKPALASNHVNILRIKDERPEYVAFVMNSMIGRLQTDRLSAGSAQAELYPKDIENYVIPFIAEQAQQDIISSLEASRILKEQSKHLLECAKRAVEIAIEQDEQTAIDWLEKETA
jgi:type I restriction enzyme M protein